MFKKSSFYIFFILSLILFFNLTNINRVNLYVESTIPNSALVETDSNIYVQEIKTDQDRFRKVGIVVKGNLTNIKIKSAKTPYTMKLKNIIIVSTLFPFNISDKNLDNYFYFRNVDVDHQKGFNNIIFKDNSSCLESRSNLLNNIFILRILIIFALSFVASSLIMILLKLRKILPPALLILILILPILLSPINMLELNGEQEKKEFPVFSTHKFKQKLFQNEFEDYLNQKLSFNNLHIRLLNTLLYYTLEKTFGSNQNILIGKNKVLYDQGFITNLCSRKKVQYQTINEYSKNIKKIQDYYEFQGKTFIVIITPSKANNYQIAIPNRFDKTPQYFEKNYQATIKAFQNDKVKYVDAKKYVKENLNNHIAYPKGGVHWADYPKYLGAKYFLQELNRYNGYDFEDLTINQIYKNNIPYGEDIDLATLSNLLIPPTNYTVEHVCLNPISKPTPKKVKVIGGSFWWGVGEMLNQAQVFENIDVYFYLIKYKKVFRDFLEVEMKNISDNETLRNDINEGDIIVLEINDGIINLTSQAYIKEFINLILNDKAIK